MGQRVIVTDALCEFDKKLFGVDEISEDEIKACAREAAEKAVELMGV